LFIFKYVHIVYFMEILSLTRFRFLLFSTRCGRVEYLKLLLYSSPFACLLQLSIIWDIVIIHCSQWPIWQDYCWFYKHLKDFYIKPAFRKIDFVLSVTLKNYHIFRNVYFSNFYAPQNFWNFATFLELFLDIRKFQLLLVFFKLLSIKNSSLGQKTWKYNIKFLISYLVSGN